MLVQNNDTSLELANVNANCQRPFSFVNCQIVLSVVKDLLVLSVVKGTIVVLVVKVPGQVNQTLVLFNRSFVVSFLADYVRRYTAELWKKLSG